MKFALCEDNQAMIGYLESIIHECHADDNTKYSLDVFMSGEEFLAHIEKEMTQYQIYILDIEMDKVNGLEVASYIRSFDTKGIIIFTTSHNEMMPEAFEVNAFQFLVKPLNHDKVKQVILKAIAAQSIHKKVFHYKIRKRISTLYIDQIYYFESFKRKIYIYSSEGMFEYYGLLKDVIIQLDPTLFVQVHNSFIVNMENIKFVDANIILLTTGLKIPITKKYNSSFNAKYRDFVLQKM